MLPQTVISAYDATAEGADGLALAHLLAGMGRGEVVVVRVLRDMVEHPPGDLAQQRAVRERMTETRRAIVAAIPGADEDELMPVLGPSLARGVHDAARRAGAGMIVLGSTHHGHLGRRLLGGSADTLLPGAPCPVAIAPPGFRDRGTLDPRTIGVAYDGTLEARSAVELGFDMATATGAALRMLPVPDTNLVAESARLGLLLVSGAPHGVLHAARCPVIVVPRGG